MEFLKIGLTEIIDIVLVALLIYQLYKLVKGTVAINIFIGLATIYLFWKLVTALNFQLLSEILGQFIGVGVIILAIVFQQELRKFLMIIGKGKLIKNTGFLKFNFVTAYDNLLNVSVISKACGNMSKTKTGAIMIVTLVDDLAVFAESGVEMNALISVPMIESIFYKNSPLHDGAVIIQNNNITVHLYEPRFKLQVQLYGQAKIENNSEKTKNIWSNLNSFSKKNYLSALSPGEKINSLDDLKYNTDNEQAFYNFSLIYFKVSKLECLQLSDIKNIRVEFVYTENSNKKYYMVP